MVAILTKLHCFQQIVAHYNSYAFLKTDHQSTKGIFRLSASSFIITLREFWAQPRTTKLMPTELLQFLSSLDLSWPELTRPSDLLSYCNVVMLTFWADPTYCQVSCNVVWCHAVLFHVTCCFMCHAMLCHVLSHVMCHVMSCVMLCHVLSFVRLCHVL